VPKASPQRLAPRRHGAGGRRPPRRSATAASPVAQRDTYHHGDLRAALIGAGYELARAGGAQAVVLREVTRRTGVSARAAYRHFSSRDALLVAVASPALGELARAIERRLEQISGTDSEQRALARLRAVGEGYVAYALDEPGGFDVAFFGLATMTAATDPNAAGALGLTPYQLLTAALDELAAVGLTDPARRDLDATYCWSAVHGFATLGTRGPIRDLPRQVLDAMATELVAATVAGLTGVLPTALSPGRPAPSSSGR